MSSGGRSSDQQLTSTGKQRNAGVNHQLLSNGWWLQINELELHSNSAVMVMSGKLNGKRAKLLLDSGASGNFLSRSFIDDGNF